jgi:hypothetical protein
MGNVPHHDDNPNFASGTLMRYAPIRNRGRTAVEQRHNILEEKQPQWIVGCPFAPIGALIETKEPTFF